jgi:hypothetical protein
MTRSALDRSSNPNQTTEVCCPDFYWYVLWATTDDGPYCATGNCSGNLSRHDC